MQRGPFRLELPDIIKGMAVLTLDLHDYFPLGSPVYYNQGWKYNTAGLKYNGSMPADSLAKSTSLVKADTVTITDAEVKEVSIPKSDTVIITDLGEVKVIAIPKSDSVSITDSGETKEIGVPKSDIFGITDSGEIKTMTLVRSDNVIITDTGEAKAISKPLSDILAIIDTVAKQIGIPFSDTLSITDADNVKEVGLGRIDTLTITDAGYTYYIPDKGPVIFISKEDVRTDIGEKIPTVKIIETTVTATSGIKLVYDGSFNYDTTGYYYDKWYSASGDLTQGERPRMTVVEKNAKMNISSDKATIKNISKER